MGKKSKRSRERDELLEKLLSKVQKLEEKLDKSDSENKSPNIQKKTTNPSDTAQDEIVLDSEENSTSTAEETQEVEPDEDWLKFLGEDPTSSQAEELKINPDLLKRWVFFCQEGMKKEDLESLLGNYAGVKELEAPKLNPQIAATMKDIAISRDKHMMEIQTLAAAVLSILGSAITDIYDGSGDFDVEKLLTRIRDAGKITTVIFNKQSVTRKAFIEPGLSKETKAVLKETKSEEFLYGKELSEKIKEAKALSKMSDTLKIPQPKARTSTPVQQLNSRLPFAKRPTGQTGSTPFNGRQKPRVFLKNRQQFVNHRAQVHQPPKMPNKSEKSN
ncbi:uncharacterized protein LOC135169114 [Diachasmimorpha longicaudata]|uniref:uncharacterized protein LOC135169114 n=1 Tax=Diachasmimorpha longicaudata TaxID=58733 RepID=UPI0030B90FB8